MRRHEEDRAPAGTAPDLRDAEWYQVAAEIAALRNDDAHGWAEATLATLQASIERTHVVTEGQRHAIARIVGSEWAPGRAYDIGGYGRRWR